jgi:hypothetical protein
LNILDRDWTELLTEPQEHNQVVPLGFQYLVKASVALGGHGDAAFRLVPYLFSLLSLVPFWRVASCFLRGVPLLAAASLFALSPALVLFAGAVKQYSVDVTVCLLLLWFALRYFERPFTRIESILAAIGACIAALLSQPAVLVGGGVCAFLLIHGRRAGHAPAPPLRVSAGWLLGASAMAYISLTTMSQETDAYMRNFWGSSFLPPPWAGLSELLWLPTRFAECIVFLVTLTYSPHSMPGMIVAVLFGVLLILGFRHLAARDLRGALLLSLPIVAAILAAAVRLLPLTGRVSLFLAPSLSSAPSPASFRSAGGCLEGFTSCPMWLLDSRCFLRSSCSRGIPRPWS